MRTLQLLCRNQTLSYRKLLFIAKSVCGAGGLVDCYFTQQQPPRQTFLSRNFTADLMLEAQQS